MARPGRAAREDRKSWLRIGRKRGLPAARRWPEWSARPPWRYLPGCSTVFGGIEGQAQLPLHHGRRHGLGRPLLLRARRNTRPRCSMRWRKKGIKFTHAYANSAVCTATRVGLITGRYQYRLPIGLQEPLGAADVGLPPEHPTIASLLQQGRLQDLADRQVASRRTTEIWPAAERLRRILGLPRRRGRLFPPRLRQQQGSVGRRHADREDRLFHRPARRCRDRARSKSVRRMASRS